MRLVKKAVYMINVIAFNSINHVINLIVSGYGTFFKLQQHQIVF